MFPIGSLSPAIALTQVDATDSETWHSANACRTSLLDLHSLSLYFWLMGSMHVTLAPHSLLEVGAAQPSGAVLSWLASQQPLLRAHTPIPGSL